MENQHRFTFEVSMEEYFKHAERTWETNRILLEKVIQDFQNQRKKMRSEIGIQLDKQDDHLRMIG